MNQDVLKSAGLELFCMTGVFPDPENIKYKNSFADDFTQKYHYILTNPPYGGDTCKKTEVQKKRDKVMNYIKDELKQNPYKKVQIARQQQLKKLQAADREDKKEQTKSKVTLPMCSAVLNKYAKSLDLDGKDKEACSLILMMQLLAPNGTAVGVLKEGVFFNKKYSKLRKALVENFNVREVISVPQDQFENTSTKTSIVVFDNTKEKTSMIKFSEMKIDKFTGDKFGIFMDEIILVENEGDIKPNGVKDVVVATATYDTFMKNDIFSLNGKDYADNTVVPGEGYCLQSICKLCRIINGYAFKKSEFSKSGIPVVKIKDIQDNVIEVSSITSLVEEQHKYNKYKVVNGDVLISLTGNVGKLAKYTNNKCAYLNQRVGKITTDNKTTLLYLYYVLQLPIISDIIQSLANGSVQKNISPEMIESVQIPIPSPEKMKQWVDAISEPYEAKIEMENRIVELETMVMKQIQDIGENEECDELKLGDVCKIKSGTFSTKEMDNKGNIPFFNASQSSIGFHSEYSFDDLEYILLIKSGNIHAESIGSVILLEGKCACVKDVLQLKSDLVDINFLYRYLKLIKSKIRNTTNNSVGLAHINISSLKEIKISIPKNKSLITALNPTFEEIQTLKQRVKTAEEKYQSLLDQLSKEAIM